MRTTTGGNDRPVSGVTSFPASQLDSIRPVHPEEEEGAPPSETVRFLTRMKSILFSGLQGG
jgi:hypothetical protein